MEVGTSLFSDPHLANQTENCHLKNLVKFKNCSWNSNKAAFSAAVDIAPNSYGNIAGGFLLRPQFVNCSFSNNFNDPTLMSIHKYTFFSTGTFLITAIEVSFGGYTSFVNNSQTALQIVSSSAIFEKSSVVTFFNNSGLKGGAVALLGLSYFQFRDESLFHFINNSAQVAGGAIYKFSIDLHDYFSSRTCFFRYSHGGKPTLNQRDNSTTFNFSGNHASSEIGHSIFASTLKPCTFFNETCTHAQMDKSSEGMLNCAVANFEFAHPLRDKNIATTGRTYSSKTQTTITTIPGKEFSLLPSVNDEYDNNVTNITLFHLSLLPQSKTGDIRISRQYEYSPTGTMKVTGKPFSHAEVTIQTSAIVGAWTNIEVHLSPCPAGFSLNNDTCVCEVKSYFGLTRCNLSYNYAYIHEGFWAGYLTVDDKEKTYEDSLYTAVCPPGYCVYNDSFASSSTPATVPGSREHALPGNASLQVMDEFMCGSTRTGVLCGECRDKHSVSYHSNNYQCVPDTNVCDLGLLIYIASDLLPLTLLFVVVLTFDISFTSGSINGFVFFAQVVEFMTIETSHMNGLKSVLTYSYELVYGFFNVEFFSIQSNDLAFCLWRGATAIDVMLVKYGTVMYALLLILAMVFLMHYCNCYQGFKCLRNRKISTSIVQGLSAFLIMCYSQCVKVTFAILRFVPLRGINHTLFVVFQNGNLTYFGPGHFMYAVVALWFLITLVIPLPLFLLVLVPLTKLTGKYSRYNWLWKLHIWLSKNCLVRFKPLLDAFQSCYKDDCRYFAGLYILYRLFIVTTQLAFGFTSGYFVICGLLVLVILVLHIIIQPYQDHRHNVIDSLIFADLIAINYTSFYMFTVASDTEKMIEQFVPWVHLCLVNLPIVCCIWFAAKKFWNFIRSDRSEQPSRDSDWPARLLLSKEFAYSSEETDSNY